MTVITANNEVQTNEEATVYVRELDMFLTVKVLEDTPAVLSLGKLCDEHGTHMSGPTVKTHISSKMVCEYSVIWKMSNQSLFLVYLQLPQASLLQHPRLLQVRKLIIPSLPQAKRMNTLLRHGVFPREEDDAIEFWRLKDDLQNKFEYAQYWSDDVWKSKMAGAEATITYFSILY